MYYPPTSDGMRLQTLKNVKTTALQNQLTDRDYINAETITEINALLPEFQSSYHEVEKYLTRRIGDVIKKKEIFNKLETICRDFLVVLKRRTYRRQHPPEILGYFFVPQSGKLPNPKRLEEWLSIAKFIINGDAVAVAAGYPAMINPSAMEVQEILTVAKEKFYAVSDADRNYDQAQERAAEFRTVADELLKDIIAQLRFAVRKFDKPSQRRIIRTYGFKYVSYELKKKNNGVSTNL